MEERYEAVKELGSGYSGVVRLARDKITNELVAVKYIERGGRTIDESVFYEINNHRSLRHRNIVRFKRVSLTPTHLAIVMEHVNGGDLYNRIASAGRLTEDAALFFFRQLISGLDYCHSTKDICHCDIKPENLLLGGGRLPRLKICDFGYSKSSGLLHNTRVGTPTYIAPEILSGKHYDGKTADVWSSGVTLFVMLCGSYPFTDPDDPDNVTKSLGRVTKGQYCFPPCLPLSPECRDLVSRILVVDPAERMTIPQIKKHPWFLKKLPEEPENKADAGDDDYPVQTVHEILRIVREARMPSEECLCFEQQQQQQKISTHDHPQPHSIQMES